MVSETYNLSPVTCEPGVDKENTELATLQYTDADRIRFVGGLPETIGGWENLSFDDGNAVGGCCRMIYSQNISNQVWYLMGTHTRLYSLTNSELTNITPVVTATTAIANSIDTFFYSLASNPLTTISGSGIVTVAATGIHTISEVGDIVEMAGATDTNGILAATLNADHIIRTIATDQITIEVTTNASSSGTGGGGSVTVGTGVLRFNATAHDMSDGDRVKIAAATATGGFAVGTINAEHIIRNSTTNTFDVYVDTPQSTAPVTGGGGAATTFQEQMVAGECDAASGVGFGANLFGSGLFGSALTSTSTNIKPRLWSAAPYGNYILSTAGQSSDIYQWDADTTTAPAKLTNSPTANYTFVDRNIVVALGAAGTANKVQWSDRGAETVWTATPANYAGSDEIEGAGEFVSHASVRGENLLFTYEQVWLMQYLGLPNVWDFIPIEGSQGIVAQNARVSVDGVAYWMGGQNFYSYSGGSVKMMECSLRDHVYDNLNWEQRFKCFAWHNKKYNEIWFHYPTVVNEPAAYVIYNVDEGHWTNGTISRTAAEAPLQLGQYPYTVDDSSVVYQNEYGTDADGSGLNWSLTTKYWSPTAEKVDLGGLVPDGTQIGDIALTLNTKEYPQETNVSTSVLTITENEDKVDFQANCKHWQYKLAQNVVGGSFRMGIYREYVKGGTPE